MNSIKAIFIFKSPSGLKTVKNKIPFKADSITPDQVKHFESPEGAIDFLKDLSDQGHSLPSFIFIDLAILNKTGLELVEKFKSSYERTPDNAKILIFTAKKNEQKVVAYEVMNNHHLLHISDTDLNSTLQNGL
jgi:CheY-like chemotaxis protein